MKRVLMSAAVSAMLAASPLAHAMGMGGGMGGGMMSGGLGGGMGGFGGTYGGAGPTPGYDKGDANRGNVDRGRVDRGNDRSRQDAREASRDPYAALNLSAAQRQHIVRQTDGVPLFIEEVTKFVLAAQQLHGHPDQEGAANAAPAVMIPVTLQGV